MRRSYQGEGNLAISKEESRRLGTVDLNNRYVAVWAEVNTRIVLRQNALTQYITLSGTIIALMLSAPFLAPAATQTGNAATDKLDPGIIFLLIPIFSVAFAFLNYKHDKTIALLRHYLSRAEELTPEGLEFVRLGYNSTAIFKVQADRIRNLHDLAFAIAILVFNVFGFFAGRTVFTKSTLFNELLAGACLIIVIISVGMVMKNAVAPHFFKLDE
jgi:hypothetical protein